MVRILAVLVAVPHELPRHLNRIRVRVRLRVRVRVRLRLRLRVKNPA